MQKNLSGFITYSLSFNSLIENLNYKKNLRKFLKREEKIIKKCKKHQRR